MKMDLMIQRQEELQGMLVIFLHQPHTNKNASLKESYARVKVNISVVQIVGKNLWNVWS